MKSGAGCTLWLDDVCHLLQGPAICRGGVRRVSAATMCVVLLYSTCLNQHVFSSPPSVACLCTEIKSYNCVIHTLHLFIRNYILKSWSIFLSSVDQRFIKA